MSFVTRRNAVALTRTASAAALIWALAQGAAGAQTVAAQTVAARTADPEAARPAETTEIAVTARRRKEVLQDVPLAISAVSGRELNQQHLDRVSDYADKIPNFAALQQNPRVSQMAIRGVGGNANNDGAESGVGLIVDNVFLTHVGFSWNDFPDLDGVEVVRGPQGTLLGKNTTIGAVIIKTKAPSFTRELDVDATEGGDGRHQLHINATGPILGDLLAGRLTVGLDQGGGWVTNTVNGDKLLDNRRETLRGQLLFTPAASLSDRLIVEHDESNEFNNFYPAIGDANFNYKADGAILSANPKSWSNKLINLFGYTPVYNNFHTVSLDSQGRAFSKVDGASNEANWTTHGLTLTSITAWKRFYFRPANDSDYTPLPIVGAGYTDDVSQYSQEFRIANQTGGPVDWQVGAYALREDLASNYIVNFYSGATAFLFNTNALPSAILNGVNYSKLGTVHTRSYAGFGQATWHVDDRASITAGLRYTDEDRTASVIGSTTGGATLANPTLAAYRAQGLAAIGGTYGALGGVFSLHGSRTTRSVSWLINPSYRLTPDILLYASASYGEKSGAANTTASPVTASYTLPLIIQPEQSLDFEAGVKSAWLDRRLTANLNVFDDTITNYQASQISPALSTTPYLANVGKVRLLGVEFESRYAVTPGLGLTLSAGYDDARYLSYPDAPTPTELVAALGPIHSLRGYQLAGAPKVTAELGLDYHHAIKGDWQWFTYENLQYRSRVSLYNPLSRYGWQDGYSVVNAGLGIKSPRYSVLLWSKNLFDKRYLVGVGSATAFNPFIGVLGDHRTVGLTLAGKF